MGVNAHASSNKADSMDWIMSKLSAIGGFLALAGVASIILNFIGYNLRILVWIERWGTGAGWAIRIGLIVVGLLLLFLGQKYSSKSAE